MRKLYATIAALLLFLFQLNAQPQAWNTYYGAYNFPNFADNGNSIFYVQTTQLVQFDKGSGFFQYISIPNYILPCLSDHDTATVQVSNPVADPSGNLWLSTTVYGYSGAHWGQTWYYDGVNWNSFASTLTGGGMESNLLPAFDAAGNMWFNSPTMGLVKYNGSTFTNWTTANSALPTQNFTTGFVFDQSNNLWVCADSIVIKFDGAAFSVYDTTSMGIHPPYSMCFFTGLYVSPAGKVFVTNGSGVDSSYYTFDGTGWTTNPVSPSLLYNDQWGPVFFDHSGNTYISCSAGILKINADSSTLITNYPNYAGFYNTIACVETDAAGTIWMVVNGNGFESFDGNNFTKYTDPRAVLASNLMLPQLIDKQQNHWLGFWGSGGLDERSGYTFTNPWGGAYVSALTLDSAGMIWMGLYAQDSPAYYNPVAFINPATNQVTYIHSYDSCLFAPNGITIDKNNTVWVASLSSGTCSGFAKVVADSLQVLPFNVPGFNGALSAISADSTGNIWIGTEDNDTLAGTAMGLVKYDGANFTNYNTSNSGLPDNNIQTISVDSANRIWIGTFNHGAVVYDGITWTTYDSTNTPLPSNHIEWFFFKNGKTFICTQHGFCVFDGANWTLYTPQNSGLVDADCESLVVDDKCNVWVATECGLSQLVGECGQNDMRVLWGNVKRSDGSAVPGALVYLMKYDAMAGALKPIDNTTTDAHGQYSFGTLEPTVYVQAAINQHTYPALFPGYEDTAWVQQQSAAIQMNAQIVSSDITLHTATPPAGGSSLSGVVSKQGGGKAGDLRLYLMQNGQPVATTVLGIDGSFKFNNVVPGTYSIWVDKMSVNNGVAPSVTIGAHASVITAMLYPTYLEILTAGVIETNPDAQLKLFPNPSSGKFNYVVNTDLGESAELQVFSINGQRLYSAKVASGLQTLDLSSFANGVYLLHLVTSPASYQQRLVIER